MERYSDKYHSSEPTDGVTDWTPGNGEEEEHRQEGEEHLTVLDH